MNEFPVLIRAIIDVIRQSNLDVLFGTYGLLIFILIFLVFFFISQSHFRKIRNVLSRILCRIFLYALPLSIFIIFSVLALVLFLRFHDDIRQREELFAYRNSDPEIAIKEMEIEDKYGIRVYTNFDVNKAFRQNVISYALNVDKDDALSYLKDLDFVLSQYSSLALDALPEHMFILRDLYRVEDEVKASGVNCGNYIAFDADDYVNEENGITYSADHPKTIHHEFFHTLDEFLSDEQLTRFTDESESCLLTSEYACSDTAEFLADAWSGALAWGMDNEHIRILKELNTKLLSDPQNGMASIAYEELNGDEQNVLVNALKQMIEKDQDKLRIKGVQDLPADALINLKSCFSDKSLGESINAYCYNDDLILCLEKDDMEKMSADLKKINELSAPIVSDDLNDYEKIERIYRYFVKEHKSEDWDKDPFKLNCLIAAVLNDNGIYALSDGQLINVRYGDDHYWLCPYFEDSEVDALYYFMIDDELRKSICETNTPYFSVCNDDSLSYLSLNEVYLDEFDEDKLLAYVYREYAKGLSETEMFIGCRNEDICNQVMDYLLNKDEDQTLLRRIYNDEFRPSDWSYYYPGYQSSRRGTIIHIYDFS